MPGTSPNPEIIAVLTSDNGSVIQTLAIHITE